MSKNKIIIFALLIIAAILGYMRWIPPLDMPRTSVSSFEECANAGYPILESYPAQCRTPEGAIFIQSAESPITSGEGAPPGSIHNLPLPPAVAAAKKYAAAQTGVSEGEVIILTAYEREWPDSCLGLAEADEFCAQVIIPGYEITISAKGQEFVYRTNNDGSAIRESK
jgi:hypothetical protein